ncbi:MAG: molybdopterin-dependent oxidoreductase [Deltaproteobacteria bacterium]|nr:molybdopterin-dependent oxidoreductase [Deltaproteobacteria bacterium]
MTEREVKYTNCGICLAACGMEVVIEDNRVIEIHGDRNHPLSKGYLCPKGKAMAQYQSDALRVTSPREKVNGRWQEISWEEAYEKIGKRLKPIIEKHGPRSVAMYYGAGTPLSSLNVSSATGFIRALKSNRIYNVLTLEFTNRYYVLEKIFGRQYRVSQPDIQHTDCLLIFGHNPLVSLDHPGITEEIKGLSKRGAKMIVVDPRLTETARIADKHISIIPGKDLFLLEGMIHHIMAEKLYDAEFLKKHTTGSEFFRQNSFRSPKEAAELCGVPAETIIEAAEIFAKAKSAAAIGKLGVHVSPNATITYWLLEALNALTGNIDKEGGLLFNPGIFNMDTLIWIVTHGKRPRSFFGNHPYLTGSFPASELPREILMDGSDRVRALFVDVGNPAIVFPNSTRTKNALQHLDLLVCVDYYMNETAREADFFLPATHFFEADDLYITFPEHQPYPFGQWTPKLIEPPGEAKAPWDIFHDLSRTMNVPFLNDPFLNALFRFGEFIEKWFKKPGKLTPTPENYYRILSFLLGKFRFSKLISSPHGLKAGEIRLGKALKKIGRIDLAPREFVDAFQKAEVPVTSTNDYPLTLISNERILHAKTTNLRGITALTSKVKDNYVRIHPEDAESVKIEDGKNVRVETKNGAVVVRAKVDPKIRRGVVSIPPGWGRALMHPDKEGEVTVGANANILTDDENLDPLVGMPRYNAIPCRLSAT